MYKPFTANNLLFISVFLLFFYVANKPLFAQSGYEVRGKVMDRQTEEPVPFAQVAIFKPGQESPVTGMTTGEDGRFAIRVEKGVYELLVSFVGYTDKKIPEIEVADKHVDLGLVQLDESAKMMDEVVVEGKKIERAVTATMEGIEIKPDQTISNIGGTLLDVLRNTPSVSVSDDGSISLRGSNSTNILIDGRNSALTGDLEQIPASAIESIQIINNPNARYDAEAAGGVINIKLKQGEGLGNNATIEATGGTRLRNNTSVRASRKTLDFEIYGSYSYRNWPSIGRSTENRLTYNDNGLFEQYGEFERKDSEHTVNFGGSYYFGKNILSYEGVFNKEDEDDLERRRARITNLDNNNILTQYIRDNNEIEDNYTMDNALIYQRVFDNPDQEFRALVSSSYRDQLEVQNINVYSGAFDFGETPNLSPTGLERTFTDEVNHISIVQMDYSQPFLEGKLETGYKSTFRSFDNDFTYEIFDAAMGNWVNQPQITNHFLYEDQIHAAYLIYAKKFGQLNLAAGTRAEQSIVKTTLFNTDEVNEQRYLDFFPSFQAAYDIDTKHTLKLTYSRRIDRPNSRRLNPFPDVSDSLNVRIGDPTLQPEYINSFEAGYMFDNQNLNLAANLFYRRVNNQIDYIVRVEDGISYRGPRNLNTMDTYGLEIIGTLDLFEWWQVNGSYSIFGVQVDGTNLDESFTNDGISWYAKFNSDFKLPWGVSLQLTGNYTAPEIEAQGRDLAQYYLDASVRRGFFDNRATLSISCRDVFDTLNFAGENYGPNFVQTFDRKRETRILLVTIGYNFFKDS